MDGSRMTDEATPSLHDELLQTVQDMGMYGYAQDIDLIQDGQLSEVRMHEDMRLWPMEEGYAPEMKGLSEEELRQGEERISAADQASQEAISAAERVKAKQRTALEAEYGDEALFSTPGKHRKFRKGPGKNPTSEFGGRSNSKGLRHFSMKVCEKVEGKGRTTYNEVADELVNDLPGQHEPGSPGGMQYDEKNIRRRVYDALNVLMAMGIISRERKEIFWKGLPQGPQLSLDRLRGEKQRLSSKLDQQRRYIAELTQQQVTYKTLMRRNRNRTVEQLHESNAAGNSQLTALPLPFVLIQVDRNATVEIKISEDNRQAHFDFERMPFKFTGDEDVLQEMGLCSLTDAMAARALNAAGDAMSPRPAAQAGTRANGAAVQNSRAHPALPPSQATPQGLSQTSPRTNPFVQHMASKPPGSQPNGGLSHINNTINSGQPNNWLRPSVQQILMQQALLQQQQQQQHGPPRQAQQQQSPLIRPVATNPASVSMGNQQIPGAQPYRSIQGNAGLQLPTSAPNSLPPKSILSLPQGPQGYTSPADWSRLDPSNNHARMLHSLPGSTMLPSMQSQQLLMQNSWRPNIAPLQNPMEHPPGISLHSILQQNPQFQGGKTGLQIPNLQGQGSNQSLPPFQVQSAELRPQGIASPMKDLFHTARPQQSPASTSGEMT